MKIGHTERKRWLEFLLLALFLSEMSVQYMPRLWHEATGIFFGAAAVLHIYWNRRWFSAFSHGAWTPVRLLTTAVSLLLLLAFFMALLTGLPISNELFLSVLPLAWRRSITLHEWHRSAPFYLLILMGLHAGLHVNAWQAYLRERLGNPLLRVLDRLGMRLLRLFGAASFLAVAALGVYGSFQLRVGEHLLFRHIFATDAMSGSGLRYAFFLFGVFLLYAVGGMLLFRLLSRRGRESD